MEGERWKVKEPRIILFLKLARDVVPDDNLKKDSDGLKYTRQ